MRIKNLMWSFAALFALSACSSEIEAPQTNAGSDEVVISYSVKVPGAVVSRAYSDGTKAKSLHYAVYEVGSETEEGTLKPTLTDNVTMSGLEADIQLHLIKDRKYEIVFWAQAPNAPYIYRDDTQTVTVDYANAYANDDDLDAFFAFEEVSAEYSYGRTVFLTRAFAQLNFGTNDLDKAKAMHLNVGRSTISTTAYTKLNLKTKEVSEPKAISFKLADVPSDSEAFPSDDVETYVSMNYLVAPETEESLSSVTLNVDGQYERTFTNIPVRMNHRTNVFGDLFTDESNFKVMVREDYDVDAWDGNSAETGKGPNDEGIIEIGTAADFARIWFASNNYGTTYEDDEIQLTSDIDLNGKPWDPISAEENVNGEGFQGTFDGNGKTIYNLYVDLDDLQTTGRIDYDDYGEVEATYDEVYHYAGLFGQLNGATVKNLTIENVIIRASTAYEGNNGMYAGVIAGEASDSKFENITVRGTIIVIADGSLSKAKSGFVGGLVGAADGTCSFKDINIDVHNVSYVSGSDCAYVGGVTGRLWAGTFENVKSNLNVIAANPYGTKTAAGGLIGLIKKASRTLTNCSCSGTVTLNNYAGSLVDGEVNAYNMGIGGLVGAGYEISSSAQAVFSGCSSTATIVSNFISEAGVTTSQTDAVKANNANWQYMGWIDSGQSWKTNDGCLTIK